MKNHPSLVLAALLAAHAAPLHATQPEWRTWGGGEPASAPRSAEGAAPAAVPPSQVIINDLMQRQQQLQLEVRELRDLVERQGYELEQLRKSNKDGYTDLDRRLRALEQAAAPTPQGEAPVAPVGAAVAPVAATAAATSAAPTAGEQAAYDQAFALLKEGKYEQAIKAFDAFVKTYPASAQVPNARYWSGEARYVLGDLKGAMQQFELVVKEAPAHPKVPDALLKIGYLFYDLKNYAKARETLNKVKSQFPGSQAASLAEQRLKRMQQEGV